MSHPSRVRGLKFIDEAHHSKANSSHPSRVRGLKYDKRQLRTTSRVAPFAGAWIEINELQHYNQWTNVAPFAGAWIEMLLFLRT